MNKQKEIKKRALDMLEKSYEAAKKNVDKALSSGAIDVDSWDENSNAMLLPKAIVVAVLTEEASQHDCAGSSHEKYVKKEAKNISLFI